MKDLREMAHNGYGHYLRSVIPMTEEQIEDWENTKKELQARIERIDWLIQHNLKCLSKDKQDLELIETHYKHLEPKEWS